MYIITEYLLYPVLKVGQFHFRMGFYPCKYVKFGQIAECSRNIGYIIIIKKYMTAFEKIYIHIFLFGFFISAFHFRKKFGSRNTDTVNAPIKVFFKALFAEFDKIFKIIYDILTIALIYLCIILVTDYFDTLRNG